MAAPEFNYCAAMQAALALAEESAAEDEVPVGAVVVRLSDGQIVGRGRDRKMALHDPTAHAEIIALREAAAERGDWRLEGCALVVTLEPCPMCAGAAIMARTDAIVYGAANPKFGAAGSRMDVPGGAIWNHSVRVSGGLMAEECGAVLTHYFREKRRAAAGGINGSIVD